ncbi:hypothetical protein BGW36DRAFT_186102 [Talaromyces proteolyticus]|uniref:Uncharacterized protein n=1 Tax=Talaromyces proteolyticus TaxID=1131652 RepID=A0AAD4KR26_9EURO|nr:uncharacterized protein BGW36DRAFT_186102 [Talaromyces proteolyticus]KAH8696392.1 hypothetical protein BGW36DRAFT_186102 [Talaromyces proteolyticus]
MFASFLVICLSLRRLHDKQVTWSLMYIAFLSLPLNLYVSPDICFCVSYIPLPQISFFMYQTYCYDTDFSYSVSLFVLIFFISTL